MRNPVEISNNNNKQMRPTPILCMYPKNRVAIRLNVKHHFQSHFSPVEIIPEVGGAYRFGSCVPGVRLANTCVARVAQFA
jgi:hypothetical protein